MKRLPFLPAVMAVVCAAPAWAETQAAIEAKMQAKLSEADKYVVEAADLFKLRDNARACQSLRDAYNAYASTLQLADKDRKMIQANTTTSDEKRQERLAELETSTQTMRDQQKQVQGMIVKNCYSPT